MIMNEINETVGLFVLSLIICFVGLFISIKSQIIMKKNLCSISISKELKKLKFSENTLYYIGYLNWISIPNVVFFAQPINGFINIRY